MVFIPQLEGKQEPHNKLHVASIQGLAVVYQSLMSGRMYLNSTMAQHLLSLPSPLLRNQFNPDQNTKAYPRNGKLLQDAVLWDHEV